jgi:hypothetical protein
MYIVLLVFPNYLLLEKSWDIPFMNPIPQRMICAKYGQNWPSGSGEEVENEKVYRRTNRQTPDNQKSSLELSAQVTQKVKKAGQLCESFEVIHGS